MRSGASRADARAVDAGEGETAGLRRLQSGAEDVVLRSGAPENPAVVAGVVDRLLLLFDLLRAVLRFSERESLDPGAHMLRPRDPQPLIARASGVDGRADDLVRLRVRTLDAE